MSLSYLNAWRNINFYPMIRPVLFQLDAEKAHHLALTLLKKGLGPKATADYGENLRTKICGINFPNPIGLAAGFDKHAEVMGTTLGFGFGFMEVGSITPRPQAGNPKPRLFRIPEAKAIINRFGFNSHGFEACLERIQKYKEQPSNGIIGINIGKNKETKDAADDYVRGIELFSSSADYLTVNVSSPNTPGLRDLQGRTQMTDLIKRVLDARRKSGKNPPVFIKIAPDQTDESEVDIAEVVLASGIDGVIIGNTTVTRPGNLEETLAKEAGGLSGQPLFSMSTKVLSSLFKKTAGKIPLIGCGGIQTPEDVYAKIRAGASLVQVYSALIYEGPNLIPRLNKGLSALLKRDGFNNVSEAVGIDHK